MFDVGFSEICLVGLVSLLVIGPEKLPEVARFVGFWVGKARRMANSVQREFKENLYADEVRQLMQQQTEMMENLELESKGMQNLLEGEIQHLQTDLVKTLTDLHPNQAQNSKDSITPDLLAKPSSTPAPQIVPPLPPLKRSKSKQQRRHGKK